MKLKLSTKLLALLTIIFLFVGYIGEGDTTTDSITYRCLVDGYKGFYRVVIADMEPPPYEDHTLNVNIGDKMVWINDDLSETLTIISNQDLWKDKDAILRHTGSQFSYVFDRTGTFTFYIKQHKSLPEQTIIVSELTPTPSPTPNTTTPVPTPNTTTPVPTPNTTTPVPTPNTTTPVPTPNTTTPVPTPNATTPVPTPTDTAPTPTPSETTPMPTPNHTQIITISTPPPTPEQTDYISPPPAGTDTIGDMSSVNPILAPIDISKNIKKTGLISFVIAIMVFLIRE